MPAFKKKRLIEPGKKEDLFQLGLITYADSLFEWQHMENMKNFWWVCVPKIPSAFAIDAGSKRPAGGEFPGVVTEAPCEQSFSYSGRFFSSRKSKGLCIGDREGAFGLGCRLRVGGFSGA
jgi:hypothetical protein